MTAPLVSPELQAENAQRAEDARRAALRLASEYRATFEGAPAGRHVWEDLQRVCFLHRSTVPDAIPTDACGALVNEGTRTVALYILGQIEAGRRVQDEPEAPTHARTTL